MIVAGAIVVVRLLAFGVRFELVPGLVLGIALIWLGAHRLSLIARLRGGAR
jgi:hypothetical protein